MKIHAIITKIINYVTHLFKKAECDKIVVIPTLVTSQEIL